MANEHPSSTAIGGDSEGAGFDFSALPSHIRVKIFAEVSAEGKKALNECGLVCKSWEQTIEAHRGRELPIRETDSSLQFKVASR